MLIILFLLVTKDAPTGRTWIRLTSNENSSVIINIEVLHKKV